MTNQNHDPKEPSNMINQTTPDQTNSAEPLDETLAVLTKHVVFPTTGTAVAATLWIAATHGVPFWSNAPRLIIQAPDNRCGTSRLLDLIQALTHNSIPEWTASPKALLRIIGQKRNDPPTLLFDEADTIYKTDNTETDYLQGILHSGFDYNRPFIRYDETLGQVEQLPTFAMAALATQNPLPFSITNRAINIHMTRQTLERTVAPYRRARDAPALRQLGQQLHRWVRAHRTDLTNATPDIALKNRQADIWEPLIAIADLTQSDWPELARQAAAELANPTPA